jgi:hypothetical protein
MSRLSWDFLWESRNYMHSRFGWNMAFRIWSYLGYITGRLFVFDAYLMCLVPMQWYWYWHYFYSITGFRYIPFTAHDIRAA